ncbi:MAG: amidohydrolase family protein, partial [Methanosarcinales archaeon]
GMSGAKDYELEYLYEIRERTRKHKKWFAIHAGEKDWSDIDRALELEPDILIHLTHANKKDLKKVKDIGASVVVCPRSNLVTKVGIPPIVEMIETGITVGVGTDNVMLNSVNMFSEMEFLSKLFSLEDRQIFKMCTLNSAKVLKLDKYIGSILKGKRARLIIFNKNSNNLIYSKNILSSIVRRARPDDILRLL